jgi:hypothetical protein
MENEIALPLRTANFTFLLSFAIFLGIMSLIVRH